MKKFLLGTTALLVAGSIALAQSQFPANTIWGNATGSRALPKATALSAFGLGGQSINVTASPYLAVCDGVADDTTKIQSAATAAAAGRLDLNLPRMCKTSAAIDVSGVQRVYCSSIGTGVGTSGGGIISSSTTANGFLVNSTQPIVIENCAIRASVVKTAGAGILFTGNGTGHIARANLLTDQWRGIQCDACIVPLFMHNQIVNFINHGYHIQNSVNPDSGDGIIFGGYIITAAGGTTVGIYQLNSGGWDIGSVKMFPSTYGVFLDRDNGAATGIYRIHNVSFDTQSQGGVVLQATGTGTFEQIDIDANIMSAQVNCVQVLGANANILQVNYRGGICNYSNTGANLQAGNKVTVGGVQFFATVGGNPDAIRLAAAWPNLAEIGVNFYFNTTSKIAVNGNANTKIYPVQTPNLMTSGGIPYLDTQLSMSSTAACTGVNTLLHGGSPPACSAVATADINNNAITLAKLATQAANTTLSNATAGAAVPTAFAMPSCSTAGSALNWTTSVGFGCNTSITAAALSATLAVASGGTGDTGTAYTSATPAPGCNSGTFTLAATGVFTKALGKTVFVSSAGVVITTNGTCAGGVRIPLGFTAARTSAFACNDGTNGLQGQLLTGNNFLQIYTNTGAYPGADGKTIFCSGVGEST